MKPIRLFRRAVAAAASLCLALAGAQAHAAAAYLRVVDVGNGLCVIIRTPDRHSLVYDAGDRGGYCVKAVKEVVTEAALDLLVLSHSDADHITDVPAILTARPAAQIVYAIDDHASTQTLLDTRSAVQAAALSGAKVWDLATTPLPSPDTAHQRVFHVGSGGVATLVAGWSNGDMTRGPGEAVLPEAEHNNALSRVLRFEYGGHSVLLTGDTVGRLKADPNTTCAYAERIMSEHVDDWPIASDVLIGQHHGGNNASSNCFIRAVHPTWVVFSAGHKGYRHPTQAAADRLIANGVDKDHMLRTDRGDDEGPGEWVYGDIKGCIDQPGDDDVEIWFPDDGGPLKVQYRDPPKPCATHTAAYHQPQRHR